MYYIIWYYIIYVYHSMSQHYIYIYRIYPIDDAGPEELLLSLLLLFVQVKLGGTTCLFSCCVQLVVYSCRVGLLVWVFGLSFKCFVCLKWFVCVCMLYVKALFGWHYLSEATCNSLTVNFGGNLELQTLQTRSLHPRSHWSQYVVFPDIVHFILQHVMYEQHFIYCILKLNCTLYVKLPFKVWRFDINNILRYYVFQSQIC